MNKVSDLNHIYSGLKPPKIINQPKATERRFTEDQGRRWHNLKQFQRYGHRRLINYQKYQHFLYKSLSLGNRKEVPGCPIGVQNIKLSDHTVIYF